MYNYNEYDFKVFHTRMAEARKKIGLSQDELAKKMKYANRNAIAGLEAGKVRMPRLQTLLKIANALDCDIEYLLGKIDTLHKPAADISEATGITNEAAEILIKHSSMTENILAGFINSIILYPDFIPLAYNWFALRKSILDALQYDENIVYKDKGPEHHVMMKQVFEATELEKTDLKEFKLRKEFENYIRFEREKAYEEKIKV